MTPVRIKRMTWTMLVLAVLLTAPARLFAHCDGLDGPVVRAAQLALESRNPAPALMWVRPEDEREIRVAFEQTLAVRTLNPQARALADRFFFETLVRIHRSGEGEPFTGLKPAGRDLGPAIPAADKAVHDGSVEPVLRLLEGALRQQLHTRFAAVMDRKNFEASDIAAGREYVTAYITFIRDVERLYGVAATVSPDHVEPEARPSLH